MNIRVGCTLTFETAYATPMVLVVRPHQADKLRDEHYAPPPDTALHAFADPFGNRLWRFVAPAGRWQFDYRAIAIVSPEPDPVLPELAKMPVEDLPDEVLPYTLASRYCQSDLLGNDAWRLFGSVQGGWAQVQAICDWLHENIHYMSGSTSDTSSFDVYQARRGVCRDFAHLGVTFCRALNIPARYVSGYLPDIGVPPDPRPMDFHAYFEAFLGGAWRVFDPRHNTPRIGRVPIAYGRDAVDAAFSTSYGAAKLLGMMVVAEAADDQTGVAHAGRTS